MKDILWCDFESYSAVSLKLAGGHAYCNDDSTNVLCLGYALNDEDVQVWTPDKIMPQRILDYVSADCTVATHSASFDRRIWNNIMVPMFEWPRLSLDQMLDTMGLAMSYALPAKLSEAGKAMNITMQKDMTGTMLIKKLCKPNKQGEQPSPKDPVYAEDFKNFFMYCKRDVEAMRELIQSLPRQYMIPQEHKIWDMTCKMNDYGLPVAYNEAVVIRKYLDTYIENKTEQVFKLSGGAFQTINQIAKIKDWCIAKGYPIENMQAATVEEALEDPKCPASVKLMLSLRQELGRTSTAKFKKIIEQAQPGKNKAQWVYDNLMYHGAATGRWTGRGFQMHNLPRASVSNPEELIKKFMDNEQVDDPVSVGKALIRPMIKCPPGWSLIVSDYSSIENRVLHWLAMDDETIKDFDQGVDQYKTMAAARYHVPYDEVTKSQRQMGKVIILGAGYGMGWETFKKTAKLQFQMDIDDKEAQSAIAAYRARYFKIPELWKGFKAASIRTVLTGKKHTFGLITFGTFTIKGTRWLAMQLPSKKCLYYKDPAIDQQYIPKYERMGKVPVVTHEGFNSFAHKWMRMALIPGRVTENACQATAREIMAYGMLNVQEALPIVKLIGTVHDEALGLVHENDIYFELQQHFNQLLCDVDFAKDCPLEAKGYIAKRYRKE